MELIVFHLNKNFILNHKSMATVLKKSLQDIQFKPFREMRKQSGFMSQ